MDLTPWKRDEGEETLGQVDREVRRILDAQERRAEAILSAEVPTLRRLADALLERESLNSEELEPLVGRVPEAAPDVGAGAAA